MLHTILYSYSCTAHRLEELRFKGLLCPHSLLAKWEPVSTTEMEGGLFTIVLNMGLLEMPQILDYWSTLWTSDVPFFKDDDS